MKRILFIEYGDITAPAHLFSGFSDVQVVMAQPGDNLTGGAGQADHDALVVMGNPGAESEDGVFIRLAVDSNVPVLGIGAGARHTAAACNAAADIMPLQKPALTRLCLTSEGRKDILFFGITDDVPVFQDSDGILTLPEGVLPLALSEQGAPLAFRYRNTYVLDFLMSATREQAGDMNEQDVEMVALSRTIYGNFLWLIDLYRLSEPSPGVGRTGPAGLFCKE